MEVILSTKPLPRVRSQSTAPRGPGCPAEVSKATLSGARPVCFAAGSSRRLLLQGAVSWHTELELTSSTCVKHRQSTSLSIAQPLPSTSRLLGVGFTHGSSRLDYVRARLGRTWARLGRTSRYPEDSRFPSSFMDNLYFQNHLAVLKCSVDAD